MRSDGFRQRISHRKRRMACPRSAEVVPARFLHQFLMSVDDAQATLGWNYRNPKHSPVAFFQRVKGFFSGLLLTPAG